MTADPAGPPETDAAVIKRSLAEPERFEEIFRRWFARIHQYLGGRVGGKIADDLAAEVFARAFAQRERYDLTRDSAGPWLYGIATNLAGTYWRQERSRYRALARSRPDGAAPSDEDLITDRMSAAAAARRWPRHWPLLTGASGTCCCWPPWPAWATRRSPSHSAFPTARCAPG